MICKLFWRKQYRNGGTNQKDWAPPDFLQETLKGAIEEYNIRKKRPVLLQAHHYI